MIEDKRLYLQKTSQCFSLKKKNIIKRYSENKYPIENEDYKHFV